MTSTNTAGQTSPMVFAGVDTHADTHHAAVIDDCGRRLADKEFAATTAGYADLLGFITSHGHLAGVGVEGTGSYGKSLARVLAAAGIAVVEVNRPDRRARRFEGKSDPTDAYAAATATASGRATATPKTGTGAAEAIRLVKTTRDGAVKARTAAINTLKAHLVTAPQPIRTALAGLTGTRLITTCAHLHHQSDHDTITTAAITALTNLAARIQHLTTEITALTNQLDHLTQQTAPTLRAIYGIGPDTAATLIAAAGDNPHRLATRQAFARYTGCAPIPASSGKTHRHRLHTGGHRQANRAIHQIALVRLSWHQETKNYATKRTQQGLSKKDTIRCLKTYIARQIHHALTT